MKFHNPPMGSGLGPWQERLVWAHDTIHPSEPSSPGWTIGNGSIGHHDQIINVWWTGVMAPATNLTAPVAWTAHTPASTHVWHYNLTALQCWWPGLHTCHYAEMMQSSELPWAESNKVEGKWKRTREQKGMDQGKGNAGMRMKAVLTRLGCGHCKRPCCQSIHIICRLQATDKKRCTALDEWQGWGGGPEPGKAYSTGWIECPHHH